MEESKQWEISDFQPPISSRRQEKGVDIRGYNDGRFVPYKRDKCGSPKGFGSFLIKGSRQITCFIGRQFYLTYFYKLVLVD